MDNNPTQAILPPENQPQPTPLVSKSKNILLTLGIFLGFLLIFGGGAYLLIKTTNKPKIESLTKSPSPSPESSQDISPASRVVPSLPEPTPTPNPDYAIKDFAVRYVTASMRYYISHNGMPWSEQKLGGVSGCAQYGGVLSSHLLTDTTGKNCLQALLDAGELTLPPFVDVEKALNRVTVSGTPSNVVACYVPESEEQRNNLNTKYTSSGAVKVGCPSTNKSDACYWCATL